MLFQVNISFMFVVYYKLKGLDLDLLNERDQMG